MAETKNTQNNSAASNNQTPSSASGNAVTDSVIALNQIVLGSAASTAMSTMYVSMAHAAGVGAQNSVASQQHMNILGASAVAAGCGNLLWEGLKDNVSKITLNDRVKYWQDLIAISAGKPIEGDAKGDGDKKETGEDSQGNAAQKEAPKDAANTSSTEAKADATAG